MGEKQLPELYPGWKTVRKLGAGSFGTVYEIERDLFGRIEKAALKCITIPQNDSDVEEMYSNGYDDASITAHFENYLSNIVREYSLMAEMKGHTNVVYCDDIRYVPREEGVGWDITIKMELLTPLLRFLGPDFGEEQVVRLGSDICRALVLCRDRDIVHRDIKPQNIFVSKTGDYKLGDFGIAKTVERTTGGTKIGTYSYMAPEVYHSKPYGSGADIYSLGLVMYWLLNERRLPFLPLPPKSPTYDETETARHRRFIGEKLPEPKNGSEALKRIVLKACAYDPKERYASAAEMMADLDNIGVDYEEEEGTIGVVPGRHPPKPPIVPPDTPSQPPLPPVPPDPPVIPPSPPPTPKKKLWVYFVALAGVGLLLLLLLLKSCGGGTSIEIQPGGTSTVPMETTVPQETTVPEETMPFIAEFTDWMDILPEYVTHADYVIEEQTLYSTQKLEKTTSTKNDKLDGWTLVDTISNLGEYGPWSEWSTEKVSETDTRKVETQTRYRYKTKETTTSSAASKDGWEMYETTYTLGEYGSWSGWSATAVSGSDSREVATKTQYQYRDKWVTQEYSDWGSWSNWSSNRESTSDLKKEDTRSVYGYYYFRCPNCGMHWYGSGITCFTWAGGCGQAVIPGDSWHEVWSTTSWANAGFWEYYGTGHYAASINGSLVFKWTTGYDGSARTQYRYATRTVKDVINYGEWSDFSDTVYTESSSRDVNTRTMYRYRDRQQVPVYHFYRWGNWSDWSTKSISENNNQKVETKNYYRYQDKITETTYCFERWTDWSEFDTDAATESAEQKVQTKVQYRYRSKTEEERRTPR